MNKDFNLKSSITSISTQLKTQIVYTHKNGYQYPV